MSAKDASGLRRRPISTTGEGYGLEPPDGTEADLICGAIPEHLLPVAREAVAAAKAAGAKRAVAVWAATATRGGLWVALIQGPEAAHNAARQAVARHDPAEAVRVVELRDLSSRAQQALFLGAGGRIDDEEQGRPVPAVRLGGWLRALSLLGLLVVVVALLFQAVRG